MFSRPSQQAAWRGGGAEARGVRGGEGLSGGDSTRGGGPAPGVWAWGAEALEKGSAPVEWVPFAECLFGAALLLLMMAVLMMKESVLLDGEQVGPLEVAALIAAYETARSIGATLARSRFWESSPRYHES